MYANLSDVVMRVEPHLRVIQHIHGLPNKLDQRQPWASMHNNIRHTLADTGLCTMINSQKSSDCKEEKHQFV